MEKGEHVGMQTFEQSLYELLKADKITFDNALENADSRNNLRLRLRLENPSKLSEMEDLVIEDKPDDSNFL